MSNGLTHKYSSFEALMHDFLVANHALNLHTYIIEHAHLAGILAKGEPFQLLDVGCGGGQLAIYLKKTYTHLHFTGVDLSPSQIARARRRANQRGYKIHFQVADAQSLPFQNEHFDVVYSFGSAKHWPDPLQGFSECWRVLKSGGEMLVADATSDATKKQVKNFYKISQFPKILEKPVIEVLYRHMFQPARSIETYQEIAKKLKMPPGIVYQLPSMPAFIFRTQKP